MLQKNDSNEHTHINDTEFEREMTVAIYNSEEISSFNERTRKLILKGE